MRLSSTLLLTMLVAAYSLPAAAQFNMGARQKSDQPVNISSDTLEVQQDKQLAIFRGKVDVVQGESRLRSEELFVHYRERGAQPATQQRPAQQKPGPAIVPGGPDATSITKVEAKGSVFVSTPKERAQGDLGIYDVDKNTITLTGNVLLTSDQSTVRCARVVMYQDTGRSTCEPLTTGGRVQAVIVPNNVQQQPTTPAPGNQGQRR